jgi:hypothetical protein
MRELGSRDEDRQLSSVQERVEGITLTVDGPRSRSAPTGDTGRTTMAAEGSRVPSAAHAAGAFLARRPSQEPDDLAHGRQGGGQIAW